MISEGGENCRVYYVIHYFYVLINTFAENFTAFSVWHSQNHLYHAIKIGHTIFANFHLRNLANTNWEEQPMQFFFLSHISDNLLISKMLRISKGFPSNFLETLENLDIRTYNNLVLILNLRSESHRQWDFWVQLVGRGRMLRDLMRSVGEG